MKKKCVNPTMQFITTLTDIAHFLNQGDSLAKTFSDLTRKITELEGNSSLLGMNKIYKYLVINYYIIIFGNGILRSCFYLSNNQ